MCIRDRCVYVCAGGPGTARHLAPRVARAAEKTEASGAVSDVSSHLKSHAAHVPEESAEESAR
eukprot:2100407-Rhodomonas_salina.1